jgi:tetratricopeptide (TPR) repeat protein
VAFREAKCPNCGGELRIPDDKTTVKCMYCSSDIVVRQAIQAAGGANIENFLNLARIARDAGNNEEAYGYYTKVLEMDPGNCEAWFGKGESAGWTSTLRQFRLPEMLTAFQKALGCVSPDKKENLTTQIANTINSVAVAYYKLAKNQLKEYIAVGNTWSEYLEQCSIVIQAIERAHEYAPTDKQIIENIIFICKDNIEGVAYDDHYDTFEGIPTPKVARISQEYETALREKIGIYEAKLKQLDPSYQPVTIKKASTCFVATATMDDAMHPFVLILQEFRDKCLMKTTRGCTFIKHYYTYGPYLASLIKKSRILRWFSLILIVYPSAQLAKYLLKRDNA